MRLSRFEFQFIWAIPLAIISIILFSWDVPEEPPRMANQLDWLLWVNEFTFKNFTVFFILLWNFGFSLILRDIVAFKYKLVEKENGKIEAKYLSLFYIFIPTWGNVAGHSKSYETKKEALERIERHKQEIIRNRKDLFKRPKKNKTTYYDK